YVTDEFSNEAIVHHSFVQFLRAFIPNPPLWMREGFAVYFARTGYDPGFQQAVYRENLAWLATLKQMMSGDSPRPWIPWDELLRMSADDVRETAESFYPQAWGLVSFLLHDQTPETNRLAWDSISAVQREHSLEENNQAVYERAFRWESAADLQARFQEYVNARRTFSEWVTTGMEWYDNGDRREAERAMVEALHLRQDHHVPYYYLGLIAYDRQDFETAASYYQQALEYTDSPGVVRYALAVNAVADDRPEEAREFLEAIPRDDPSLNRQADELLRRLSPSGGR
ncbi:MAG: tetratricopeptide repeat protein, partial [Alkalispirochaeta sp.]